MTEYTPGQRVRTRKALHDSDGMKYPRNTELEIVSSFVNNASYSKGETTYVCRPWGALGWRDVYVLALASELEI